MRLVRRVRRPPELLRLKPLERRPVEPDELELLLVESDDPPELDALGDIVTPPTP